MSCLVDINTELPICSNICRLCVQKEEILWNIFEVCDNEGVSLKLPEKMVTLLDIMVEIDDGLPDQVCAKCMTAVRCFFEFRRQCKEHDSMLRNSLVTHDEPNPQKTVISGFKHLERDDECQAENHFETSLNRTEECHDTQPEDQTSLFSPPMGQEASGSLFDSNINISVVEQLQEEWDQDDDCEVVASHADLKKPELPWRLGAEILNGNKIEEKNCVVKNHSDSSHSDSNVNPLLVLDRATFSTHASGSVASKHPANKNLHDDTENFSTIMIVHAVENLEASSESAHTDTVDKGNSEDSLNQEPSEEMFAGKISRNQLGLWVCNVCNQEYDKNNLRNLKRHVAMHYSNWKNQCPECQIMFESPEELSCHKMHHVTSSLVLGHACDQCHKSFRRKHLLVKHVALEHTSHKTRKNIPKKFRVTCGKCVRVFYSSVEMEDHDESCTEGMIESEEDTPEESDHSSTVNTAPRKKRSTRRECYLCKLDFDNFRQLKFHFAKVHKGEKPLKCDMPGCEKLCEKPSQFYNHKKSAHCRRFICDHCDKAFIDKTRLLAHIRLHHLNQRPFKCSTCDKAFASVQTLRYHKHSHTKKYKCDSCGARFGSHYNLTRHLHSHSSEKTYVCEHCGLKFGHSANLSIHQNRYKSKNMECSECGIKFCTQSKLRIHIHQHTKKKIFTCKLCGVQYLHMSSLESHKKKHHSSNTSVTPSL